MPANTKTIKAAVCRQFGAPLSVEDLTPAPPAARDVRVRLAACAVCHSDITYIEGGWGGDLPMVAGHEAAGVVTEAGAEADIAVGSRVVVTLLRSCGDCALCSAGAKNLCEWPYDAAARLRDGDGKAVTAGLRTAAFAEEVVVDKSQVAVIDDDLPLRDACVLACGVLTGWGSVMRVARVPAGASVAVVGCGGVGVNCAQAAAAAGARSVVAVDLSAEKLKTMRAFGATHTVIAGDNAGADARRVNGGVGFDYVFMAAGSARAAELAAALLAKTGALIVAGIPPDGEEMARINLTDMVEGQLRFFGSKMGGADLRADIPALLSCWRRGELKIRELVAAHYPLEEINAAIAAAKTGSAFRHVIVFGD